MTLRCARNGATAGCGIYEGAGKRRLRGDIAKARRTPELCSLHLSGTPRVEHCMQHPLHCALYAARCMLHGTVHTSVFSHWIFCSGPVTAVHLRFPPAASSTALHSSATVCVTEPLTQILSDLPASTGIRDTVFGAATCCD